MTRTLLFSLACHLLVALIVTTTSFRAPPAEQKSVVSVRLVPRTQPLQSSSRTSQTQDARIQPGRVAPRFPEHEPVATRNGLLSHNGISAPLALPTIDATPSANEPAPEFARKSVDPLKHESSGWSAKVRKDGSVELTDAPIYSLKNPFALPGFDEVVMRIRGDKMYDPQKRKFLAETRSLRQDIATDHRKENGRQAVQDIQSRMALIWNDEALSVADKKRKLFELWDECAEDGPEEVLSASAMVRVSIVSFINRHLPSQSEMAYARAELSDLNSTKKSSKTEFQPYEPSDS